MPKSDNVQEEHHEEKIAGNNLNKSQIIVAIIVGLIAIYSFFQTQSLKKPTFKFSYPNASSTEGFALYEITQGLSDGELDLGKIEIIVSAIYDGKKYPGPISVQILGVDNDVVFEEKWIDFTNDHPPISFQLSPSDLYKLTGLSPNTELASYQGVELPKPEQGDFTIRVMDVDGTIFSEDKVKVVQTPWYHTVSVVDPVIQNDKFFQGHITVVNLGQRAEFNIVGNLYDVNNADFSTMNTQWYAEKTFGGAVDGFSFVGEIEANTEKTFSFELNQEVLISGHIYLLETTTYKKLPYLEFPSGTTWETYYDRWLYRDELNYTGLLVLED